MKDLGVVDAKGPGTFSYHRKSRVVRQWTSHHARVTFKGCEKNGEIIVSIKRVWGQAPVGVPRAPMIKPEFDQETWQEMLDFATNVFERRARGLHGYQGRQDRDDIKKTTPPHLQDLCEKCQLMGGKCWEQF